ncbi:hypothetical protein Trydic_g19943, partial [Trypoxylus dichotomus]
MDIQFKKHSSRGARFRGRLCLIRCEAMTFFSCYLTPNESIQQFRTKIDALEDAIFNTQGEVIVGGDFNAKAIEWGMPHPDSRGRYILEMAARTGLIVLNEREVTTFRRPGYSETIPDVSFASEALVPRIVDWKVSESYTGSDHQAITFTVYGRSEARCRFSPNSGGWNFGKLDTERFCRALPPVCRLIAGSEVDARERVERLVESTMSGIASACDASMPRKAPRHCKRAAYWWTAEIAELRKRCLRLRRIAQRAGNREEANIRSAEHREAKKSLRRAINESKARHWKDMVSDVDSEPWGLGYKLVTRRLGVMKPPAILELTRMQRIVRALFPSHPARMDRGLRMPGDFLPFNEEELRTVMGSLAQRRAPGPDNITNEILKLVYQHSPHLLLDMYNECLAAGVFATRWKVARLVLITKKQGDPDDPSTYRPLCMLDTAGKVLERLIRTRLQAVMEDAGGLSPRQYGFRRGRSTADALREVCDAVTRAENHNHYSRRIVLLVTLDVRNAFNSARWVDILNALEHSFRVPPYLLRMIDDYLGNRSIIYDTNQGRCNDKVTSGVAQGSILGPDFWNILYDGLLRQEMPEEVTLVG